MYDQYEVATTELGVVFRTSDRDAAEDFGRWFRDRNALAVRVISDEDNCQVASFPVNR